MHKKSREDTQTKQSLRWPQILRCFVEYTILKERRSFLLQLVITPNVLKVLKVVRDFCKITPHNHAYTNENCFLKPQ